MTTTNSRGYIAAVCPANTDETVLYAVSAATDCDGILRVINLGSSTYTYRIAHTNDAGAASSTDWIAYDTSIAPGVTYEYSIHIGTIQAAETIRVKSSSANNINFHFSGNKKVTS